MILAIIVGCEIGFWVLIVLGLIARYVLRLKRTGVVLLAITPVVDLILLAATVIDMMAGAMATLFHGIAAIYLGVSVAYGHKMISWADIRFAHKFAAGPAPVKKYGRAYAGECWKDVARTTLAVVIAAGILWLITSLVDDVSRTSALSGLYGILGLIVAAELLWALGYTLWPKAESAPKPA
ncbi:hypothetical protein [Arthrobacter sp. CG_A4]|uniref:hypothetical protein n=1 Tax=Arthrobacter sp. CG_A4 TaxID=3071706 RepID=UPI002E00FD8B|nr:hypothetical protein [Arthrobacter sp. CG_A4]